MKKQILLLASFLSIAAVGTLNAQNYCAGGPTSTFDSNVEAVSILGDATSSINWTGCPGVTGVEDETALSVDVTGAQSYNLDVTFGTCGGNYGGAGEVWIDYNQNGVFETSESVGTSSGTPGTAPWNAPVTFNVTIPTTAYNGTTRMRVMQRENGSIPLDPCASFTWGSVTDFSVNISGATVLTCPSPSNLAVSGVTNSDVSLTWAAGGSELMWNIEYGPAGFVQGTGTLVPVTSTNETVTGLAASTTYDFYVQADCGGGDESVWIGPVTATTLCNSVVAPWTEGFENAGTIPNCWEQGASNAKNWEFANTGGFDHIGSDGTINGTTATNGYFAWLDDSSPHSTGTSLLSPLIDVSGLTDPMLEFYRLSDNEGNTNVDFSVDVWDGAAWNTAVYSSNSNSLNQAWEYIFVPLSGLTITGDIQIRFVVDENNGTDFYDDVAIDDVGIIETPTCLQPSALSASNATGTTVDLTWTPGGTETMWNIEYGPSGFIQGAGTLVPTGTSNYTLTGLNPTTSYDVYVQADCGGGDESFWVGPISFNTLVAPINCSSGFNTFLMDAEFENGIPNSWTNTATGDPQWEIGTGQTPSSNTGPSGAFSGGEYLFLETSGGSTGDTDTLKGSADLSLGLNEAKMYFYYHMFGGDMGELKVEVSNDGGATWTTEFSQVGQSQVSSSDAWAPAEIDLTPYLGSVLDYRIIGVKGTGFESDMAIDLFRIETCVSCPQPTALNVLNVTSSTAEVDWTIGNSETEWILEYDTTNFVVGTGNTMVTINNPETISGLMENTEYDVYVRAICGPGDTSSYEGPVTFTTPCNTFDAPYEENFDGAEWVPGSEISGCWSRNPVNTGLFWNTGTGTTPSGSTGPSQDVSGNGNYVFTEASNGSNGDVAMLMSPIINLSTVIDPYLTFSYHMYGSDVDSLTVEVSNDYGTSWDTLVTIYGEQQTDNVDPWADTSVALTNYAADDVMIRFINVKSGFNGDIAIDEFSVLPCIGSAGQDGSANVCRLDTIVDLFTAITADQDGVWSFPLDQDLIQNGSEFNVLLLPADDYEVYYIANGACQNDTAVATISVYNSSNAGQNGTLNVCQNEPVNLFDGLSGNVDLGGTWYDPSDNPIAGSQPIASSIPGSFNYDYVTSNGVCPADTSLVEVIVDPDCDYLSLGEEKLNELTVFPNPATDVINISNPSNSESLRVEILDMNGRVVLTDAKALANATEGSIDVSQLVKGMYTLRVYNEDGQKTFKVVIQ